MPIPIAATDEPAGATVQIRYLIFSTRGYMADLNQFLAGITASGPIRGMSVATLRAGARGPEYHFGRRGAHDQLVVDAKTVFEAASLTKKLVAFIALQLAEGRLLDTHRPLFDICGGRFEVAQNNAFSRSVAHVRSP